jgi:hypothetical protein
LSRHQHIMLCLLHSQWWVTFTVTELSHYTTLNISY